MGFFTSPNFNKTDYYIHSLTSVPQDLASGDIIETHDGEKLALVLGFVYNKFTQAIHTVHTVEISRNPALPKSRPVFSISTDEKRSGDVSGIDLPAYIFTDRTDRFDVDLVSRTNKRIERVGRTSSNYFQNIIAELRQNNVGALPSVRDDNLYIPSLAHLTKSTDKKNSEGFLVYGQISEDERLALLSELNRVSRRVDGNRVHSQYWDELNAIQKAGYQGYLVGKQRAKEVMRLPMQMGSRRGYAQLLTNMFDAATQPVEVPVVASAEAISAKHQETHMRTLKSKFRDCVLPNDVGVPKNLWQGRYLMINMANLDGEPPVEEGKIIHRPCAVWKAYADKDTREIVGLELHPATRSQSENYQFKMQINPLKTRSKKESLLIADCLIRVPLTSEYVHANEGIHFFELTPHEVREFKRKKYTMETQNAPQQILGLQTVPDNWVEVTLNDVLSQAQIRRWKRRQLTPVEGLLQDKLREALQLRIPA